MVSVEIDLTRSLIDDVMIATQSRPKREANERNIDAVTAAMGAKIAVDSVNPENWDPESDSPLVDEVAWKKTETLRNKLDFDPTKRTLIVAFDVSTAICELDEDGELDEVSAVDLKRMLRDIPISDDIDAKEHWQRTLDVIEAEKIRMLKRSTNGAFCIEWHVGFAINSSDGVVSNRGALVLRATFNALHPDIVINAFTISDELKEMKTNGKKPTHDQLADGMQGFKIGPRLPFAELLMDYARLESLAVFNRDYPEERAHMGPEQFLSIVRDCALPPQIGVQLLAGSLDPEITPDRHLTKPTVKLDLSA